MVSDRRTNAMKMHDDASLIRRATRRGLVVGWLALGLVGAQLAGLIHRIEHPRAPVGALALERLVQLSHAAGERSEGDLHASHGHQAHTWHPLVLVHAPSPGSAEEEPRHDCAAYDALTLGDGPPLSPATATRTAPYCTAVAVPESVPAGLVRVRGYCARAPPFA